MEHQIEYLDSVKKRIHNTGFGNTCNDEIDMRIEGGETRFAIDREFTIEDRLLVGSPEVNIHENKAYYNGFSAVLRDPNNPDDPGVRQWFPSQDRVTLEEAHRMLLDTKVPRAVYKQYVGEDNKPYGVWLQIDFSRKTKNGNHVVNEYRDFDLLDRLHDFALEGMHMQYKKADRILRGGGEIMVQPTNNEKFDFILVRANPAAETVTLLGVDRSVVEQIEKKELPPAQMEAEIADNLRMLEHDQFRTPEARQRIKDVEQTQGPRGIRQPTVSFVKDVSDEADSKDATQKGSADQTQANENNHEKVEEKIQGQEDSKKNKRQGRFVKPGNKPGKTVSR